MTRVSDQSLEQLKSRMVFRQRDFTGMTVKQLAQSCRLYLQSMHMLAELQTPAPETEACMFYTCEHIMHAAEQTFLPGEPLTHNEYELLDTTVTQMSRSVLRSFYYLALITTREARHSGDTYGMENYAKAKYGVKVNGFLQHVNDNSDMDSVLTAMEKMAGDFPVTQYFEWLDYVFRNSFSGGSFGGPPWGDISLCTHGYVNGATSMALMCDVSWSLAHNNGPIFNKGMLYSMYNKMWLTKVLDVQRAGQIPRYVQQDLKQENHKAYKEASGVVYLIDRTWELLGHEDFDPNALVDWQAVQDAGAVGKYTKKTGSTTSKPPPGWVSISPTPKVKPEAGLAMLTIMPMVQVATFKRVKKP
jgi:hypothetical protein